MLTDAELSRALGTERDYNDVRRPWGVDARNMGPGFVRVVLPGTPMLLNRPGFLMAGFWLDPLGAIGMLVGIGIGFVVGVLSSSGAAPELMTFLYVVGCALAGWIAASFFVRPMWSRAASRRIDGGSVPLSVEVVDHQLDAADTELLGDLEEAAVLWLGGGLSDRDLQVACSVMLDLFASKGSTHYELRQRRAAVSLGTLLTNVRGPRP